MVGKVGKKPLETHGTEGGGDGRVGERAVRKFSAADERTCIAVPYYYCSGQRLHTSYGLTALALRLLAHSRPDFTAHGRRTVFTHDFPAFPPMAMGEFSTFQYGHFSFRHGDSNAYSTDVTTENFPSFVQPMTLCIYTHTPIHVQRSVESDTCASATP
ncbi:hypothetical protein ZHAS_00012255 [Anopheles sinensis]|uniref:Uncharacterized protein n=1 Tax=Anopheles sinensis TaxID=74873 RepID=A0A084W2M3_ANOSI|nr:hypothetical protein ZHAS_00012255 [Anopheles sinensis]